ncbi:hypothetical protein EZV62_016937 [Acer yangbiense]|uniref:Uncharacterized protein n=1 Tax=Acer yangbiense TaxID=1000413 RepID=A0A5C7HQQ4_9ROSI|nr:hypothetical protein EZV62_016937 [Acer yangbiense]
MLPPNITVPSGWKPGIPVELPKDFPIVPPPGWKPGDVVPLPPLDAIQVPRIEEQLLRPVPPQELICHRPYRLSMLILIFWMKMMTVVILAATRKALSYRKSWSTQVKRKIT